jgi:hypothetical protein
MGKWEEKKQDMDKGKSICCEGIRNNCERKHSKIGMKKTK